MPDSILYIILIIFIWIFFNLGKLDEKIDGFLRKNNFRSTSVQCKFIDNIIQNFEHFDMGRLNNTEYDFLKDEDILLSASDTNLYGILHGYNVLNRDRYVTPLIHEHDFVYYIRKKACYYANIKTCEDPNMA